MKITLEEMIDFIIRAQSGFKVRRNSKEYISRYNYLIHQPFEQIIKIYKEI